MTNIFHRHGQEPPDVDVLDAEIPADQLFAFLKECFESGQNAREVAEQAARMGRLSQVHEDML